MTFIYTSEQISAYLHHVQLPASYHPSATPPPKLGINYLHRLHVHQLSSIPYENLSLHYTKSVSVSIDPQILYAKFMSGRGRGGYCMEASIFYYHVLYTLGFKVYMTGVKIRPRDLQTKVPSGDYIGWTHIVNIVTLPSTSSPTGFQKYMIDVGFGGDGATLPVPLDTTDDPPPLQNLGSQQIRLLHSHIPLQTDLTLPKRWVYQYRNSTTVDWNSFYAFAEETEFVAADFEVINWFASTSPKSFQTFTPLVIKFLRGAAGDSAMTIAEETENSKARCPATEVLEAVHACNEKIIGKIMLVNGEIKRNMGGKTETVAMCRTEAERIEALKQWFGIELTDEEKLGIKGRAGCLAFE